MKKHLRCGLKLAGLIIILNMFLGPIAKSQNYQSDPLTTEGQGNLVTLRLVWGEKITKLFVVGKKAAEISLGKDAEILKITAFNKEGVSEELQFTPGQGYYTIDKMPAWDSPYSLSVKTKVKGKDEEIKLKLQKRP